MIFLPMIFTNGINIEFKIVRMSAVVVALWFAIFSIPVFFSKRKKSEKLTKNHVKKSF